MSQRWTPAPPPQPPLWLPTLLLSVAILLGSFAIAKALLLPASSGPSGITPPPATPVAPQPLILPTLISVQLLPTLTPLPTATATPDPVLTAIAATLPTVTPLPVGCPAVPETLPAGSRCVWPSPADPTATPLPRCQTPIPGAVCDPWGPTPTPGPDRWPVLP